MKKSNKVVITSLSLLLVLGGCSNGQTSGSTSQSTPEHATQSTSENATQNVSQSTTESVIETASAVIKAVQIDETHFPDDVFQNYIRYEFDEDEDDILSEDEIRQATEVEVDYSDIKSLKGIEYLRELTTLSCSGADLTELDVSENRELLTLRCAGNALSSLNVKNNTKLKALEVNDSVEVSGAGENVQITKYTSEEAEKENDIRLIRQDDYIIRDID